MQLTSFPPSPTKMKCTSLYGGKGAECAGKAYHQMAPVFCKVLPPVPSTLQCASTAAPAAQTQGACFLQFLCKKTEPSLQTVQNIAKGIKVLP